MTRKHIAIDNMEMEYVINESYFIMYKRYAVANFAETSNILIYANADIFSYAMIAALYGILMRFIQNVATEHWNTQLAAVIRSGLMFIL